MWICLARVYRPVYLTLAILADDRFKSFEFPCISGVCFVFIFCLKRSFDIYLKFLSKMICICLKTNIRQKICCSSSLTSVYTLCYQHDYSYLKNGRNLLLSRKRKTYLQFISSIKKIIKIIPSTINPLLQFLRSLFKASLISGTTRFTQITNYLPTLLSVGIYASGDCRIRSRLPSDTISAPPSR